MNLQNQKKYNHNKLKYHSNIKKYFDKPISNIIFVHDYSVKNEQLKFTNFFQRKVHGRNNTIKEVIQKCISNPEFFKKYFAGTEISLKTKEDEYKINRLHNIIALYNNFQANDNNLFKYIPNSLYVKKYGRERGLQLVFEHKHNELLVYLIDLYHLAIPSGKDEKGERQSLSHEYDKRKNYHKGIEEVIFNKEMSKS